MSSHQFSTPRHYGIRAKELRKTASKTERLVWNALRDLRLETGLYFRRQHPLHPYIVDFACAKARLIIELDGISHDARQAYDAKRDNALRERGWTIVRFSNEEVDKNLQGVVLTIVQQAQEGYRKPTPNPSRKREGD